MLFGYRKGSNNITQKVWLKLEAAERAAGLGEAAAETAQSAAKVNEFAQAEAEKVADRLAKVEQTLAELLAKHPTMRSNLQRGMLERAEIQAREFFQSVSHLAEWAAKAPALEDEAVAGELKFTAQEVQSRASDVKEWLKTLIALAKETE